jgi:glycosyltransferase involved in cell wall biosynthesis
VLTVQTLDLAIVADLVEEGWPSMDLVADMLMAHADRSAVAPRLFRPGFSAQNGERTSLPTIQRIAYRFWSYPRWLRQQPPADVYHIVDHSYAHLAHELPAGRVIVTCHDTDAFRSLIAGGERESNLPQLFVRRVLAGLRKAAVVTCVSEFTRDELVSRGLVAADRTQVVPNGVHPACSPSPQPDADAAAAALTGLTGGADLLHVGSTIPRKRIDVLLESLALVARSRSDVRLWRVGGAFTPEQARRARELDVDERISVLPFVSREVLAALYRRAALVLLPSDREGFGLPVVEAMACGTPVLCSDIPVLREVGADAAEYAPVGQSAAWASPICELLSERQNSPDRWEARRSAGLRRAAAFTWKHHAARMREIYERVVGDKPQ